MKRRFALPMGIVLALFLWACAVIPTAVYAEQDVPMPSEDPASLSPVPTPTPDWDQFVALGVPESWIADAEAGATGAQDTSAQDIGAQDADAQDTGAQDATADIDGGSAPENALTLWLDVSPNVGGLMNGVYEYGKFIQPVGNAYWGLTPNIMRKYVVGGFAYYIENHNKSISVAGSENENAKYGWLYDVLDILVHDGWAGNAVYDAQVEICTYGQRWNANNAHIRFEELQLQNIGKTPQEISIDSLLEKLKMPVSLDESEISKCRFIEEFYGQTSNSPFLTVQDATTDKDMNYFVHALSNMDVNRLNVFMLDTLSWENNYYESIRRALNDKQEKSGTILDAGVITCQLDYAGCISEYAGYSTGAGMLWGVYDSLNTNAAVWNYVHVMPRTLMFVAIGPSTMVQTYMELVTTALEKTDDNRLDGLRGSRFFYDGAAFVEKVDDDGGNADDADADAAAYNSGEDRAFYCYNNTPCMAPEFRFAYEAHTFLGSDLRQESLNAVNNLLDDDFDWTVTTVAGVLPYEEAQIRFQNNQDIITRTARVYSPQNFKDGGLTLAVQGLRDDLQIDWDSVEVQTEIVSAILVEPYGGLAEQYEEGTQLFVRDNQIIVFRPYIPELSGNGPKTLLVSPPEGSEQTNDFSFKILARDLFDGERYSVDSAGYYLVHLSVDLNGRIPQSLASLPAWVTGDAPMMAGVFSGTGGSYGWNSIPYNANSYIVGKGSGTYIDTSSTYVRGIEGNTDDFVKGAVAHAFGAGVNVFPVFLQNHLKTICEALCYGLVIQNEQSTQGRLLECDLILYIEPAPDTL